MTHGNIHIYTRTGTEGGKKNSPFQMQPEEHGHDLSPQPPLYKEKEQSWLNLENNPSIKLPAAEFESIHSS